MVGEGAVGERDTREVDERAALSILQLILSSIHEGVG